MKSKLLALIVVLGLASCGPREEMRTSASAGPATSNLELKGRLAHRTVLDHPDAMGISGSCAMTGETWLVSERNPHLLHLAADGTISSVPITGVPEDLDLEGLACKDGLFYISSESEDPDRNSDLVFVVEVEGSNAAVTETIELVYPDGLMAGVNQGLEGLCIAGDWLIAAGEVLRTTSSGERQAPILRQRLGDNNAFLHWVNLTSGTGKISGIDCRMRGSIFEIFAIERHYEVSRILHFDLGTGVSQSDTVIELAHLLRPTENFESILVDDDGVVRLTNDNQYKTITGPSEETVLERIPSFARSR